MNTRKYPTYYRLFISFGMFVALALLLGACGGTPPGKTITPTSGTTPITGKTPTTVPMPSTETSCPAAGMARGAVIEPLILGSHANAVYVYNQGRGSTPHPIAAFLRRYDSVSKHTTVILTAPNNYIDQAQVSADGQWVIFTTQVAGRSALQLVRMDGQGLQTLYCSTPDELIGALAWSPDQRFVAFQEGQNVLLLNIATGAYRREVSHSGDHYYVVRTWLDNTHLYLANLLVGTETPPLNLSLLDISTATVQPVFASPSFCGDFDRSGDGTILFTSECQFAMPETRGPSRILAQPSFGGATKTIYSTPSYGITNVRVASPNTLLFAIHNTGVINVDTSHNGLWKVNTDGTGLTRLTSDAANEGTGFPFTRTPWSVVSRDGGSYAIYKSTSARLTPGTGTPNISSSLLIGSMSGGQPVAFATLARGTNTIDTLEVTGWTTM